MKETGVPGENHRPVASHWQTLSHNVVWSATRHELTTLEVIDTDCTGSCKSNYHTITATTAPCPLKPGAKYSVLKVVFNILNSLIVSVSRECLKF